MNARMDLCILMRFIQESFDTLPLVQTLWGLLSSA